MKRFKEFFKDKPFKDIQELGTIDGEFDQNHARDFVTMNHGSREEMDTKRSFRQALWVEGADTAKLKKWVAELEATEEEIIKHFPAWVLIGGVGFVAIAEVETAMFYWRDIGVTGPARIVMSIATAIVTIYLPSLVVSLWREWRENA